MKWALRGQLLALLALSLSGCDCEGEGYASDCLLSYAAQPDVARIQFLNQLADPGGDDAGAVEIDLFAGTRSDALFTGRGYTTTSAGALADLELDGNTQRVAFETRASADGLTLVSNRSFELAQDTRYVALATGTLGRTESYGFLVYPHEDQDPPEDRVSIRFVNTLSETIQPLSLVLRGVTDLAQLGFGDDSGYVRVDPDRAEIELELRDGAANTIATVSCPVDEERTYLGVLAYAAFDTVDDDDIRLFCHRR
ncbi:DUF4397 domain-containing protein [Ectothiorhodospiraceae bacterium WFHF3C12]|nr:DUF4397 domain-containing protein [Ectothiorhodospiraceae bacterium WFHF3C12]